MIPRFIVNNYTDAFIEQLKRLGYTYECTMPPQSLLVIGKSILQAPPEDKNKFIKIFDYQGMVGTPDEVVYQAYIHLRWQLKSNTKVILVNKDVSILVNSVGVLIDSFVVPVDLFTDCYKQLTSITTPFVVNHKPVINPKMPFLTIGCADFSLNDINAIIETFNKNK